jgi:hypothetical protein
MKTQKSTRLRANSPGILTALWLTCFCVCLLVPVLMQLRSGIESDTLTAALGSIADAYSANLAVILGFYFHAKLRSETDVDRSISSLVVAVVATLIWNGLALGTCFAALAYLIPIDEATKTISSVAPKLSWIVAPMLGYYFASPIKKSQTS